MAMQLIETKPKYRKYNPDIVRHILSTDSYGETAAFVYIYLTTKLNLELCDKILTREEDQKHPRLPLAMTNCYFWSSGKKGGGK